MLYQIADLIVDIPAAGGMSPRCVDYLYSGDKTPDIVIHSEKYRPNLYSERLDYDGVAYLESAYQFCWKLLKYQGFYLHASAVELDGRAYLFSGNSGIGKSTHTRLWQQSFGDAAQVFNDDKPALRRMDGTWYAYGTPWCGKDGINQNKKVPLAGICFLKQGQSNRIRQLSHEEAITRIIPQTIRRFNKMHNLDLLLQHIDKLVQEIPVFELENKPELEAASLSYQTMRTKAEEMGL